MRNLRRLLTFAAAGVAILLALIPLFMPELIFRQTSVVRGSFPALLIVGDGRTVGVRTAELALADWNDPLSGVEQFISRRINMAPSLPLQRRGPIH